MDTNLPASSLTNSRPSKAPLLERRNALQLVLVPDRATHRKERRDALKQPQGLVLSKQRRGGSPKPRKQIDKHRHIAQQPTLFDARKAVEVLLLALARVSQIPTQDLPMRQRRSVAEIIQLATNHGIWFGILGESPLFASWVSTLLLIHHRTMSDGKTTILFSPRTPDSTQSVRHFLDLCTAIKNWRPEMEERVRPTKRPELAHATLFSNEFQTPCYDELDMQLRRLSDEAFDARLVEDGFILGALDLSVKSLPFVGAPMFGAMKLWDAPPLINGPMVPM